MKQVFAILLALALVLSGCTAAEQQSESSGSSAPVEDVDIHAVAERICEDIDIEDLAPADEDTLTYAYYIEPEDVTDWVIMTCSGRFGVAEVGIFQPAEGRSDAIIEGLQRHQDDRIKQFENYDVHDSLSISQNAEIFEQGGYIVYLMLDDVKAAKDIIFEMMSTGNAL